MQSRDVGHNNENGPRSKKIKYVSLSYILFGLSQISSKAFCQKKLFASPLSTPSAVVTVRLVMCQMCTILSCTNSRKTLLVKTSLVWQLSHSICMVDDDGLQRIFFAPRTSHILSFKSRVNLIKSLAPRIVVCLLL